VTGLSWIDAVLEAAADDEVRRLVRELTVEPLPADAGQDARYAIGVLARLLELDASRRIDDLKGRLQRLDAGSDEYDRTFADLLALEDYRRSLREESQGGAA
jgi:DNA primase